MLQFSSSPSLLLAGLGEGRLLRSPPALLSRTWLCGQLTRHSESRSLVLSLLCTSLANLDSTVGGEDKVVEMSRAVPVLPPVYTGTSETFSPCG